jgi:DNA repair and recombination protein RAD52
MSFTPEQTTMLTAPLDKARVATREQGGKTLSYIEAWHGIAEANRIFGFGRWDRETVELRQLGEPRMTQDKYGKDQMRVGYSARVRITVRAGDSVIVREGCGFGSGIDRDTDQAHESALKEAESDAMKRALMTFGNPFGLALYDKTQANVAAAPPPPADPATTLANRADGLVGALNAVATVDDLEKAWAKGAKLCADLDLKDPDKLAAITTLYEARRDELTTNPFPKAA